MIKNLREAASLYAAKDVLTTIAPLTNTPCVKGCMCHELYRRVIFCQFMSVMSYVNVSRHVHVYRKRESGQL